MRAEEKENLGNENFLLGSQPRSYNHGMQNATQTEATGGDALTVSLVAERLVRAVRSAERGELVKAGRDIYQALDESYVISDVETCRRAFELCRHIELVVLEVMERRWAENRSGVSHV